MTHQETFLRLLVAALLIVGLESTAPAYYSSEQGRFISRDPINGQNVKGSTNEYSEMVQQSSQGQIGPVRVTRAPAPQPRGRVFKRDPLEHTPYADGVNLYQYVHSDPLLYIDPSGKKSCLFIPWRAGSIDFKGCTGKQLSNFRLIPEDPPYDSMNIPSYGRNRGIDGFWHKYHNQWFKVAGFCHATVTCDPPTLIYTGLPWDPDRSYEIIEGGSGFTYDCCCNGCLTLAERLLRNKGTCGLYNNAGGTAHRSSNPFR